MKIDMSSLLQGLVAASAPNQQTTSTHNQPFANLLNLVHVATSEVPAVREVEAITVAIDDQLQSFLAEVKAPKTKVELMKLLQQVERFMSGRLDDQLQIEQTLDQLTKQIVPMVENQEQKQVEQVVSLLFRLNAKATEQTKMSVQQIIVATATTSDEQVEHVLTNEQQSGEEQSQIDVSLYNLIQALFVVVPIVEQPPLSTNGALTVPVSPLQREVALKQPIQQRPNQATLTTAFTFQQNEGVSPFHMATPPVTNEALRRPIMDEVKALLLPIVETIVTTSLIEQPVLVSENVAEVAVPVIDDAKRTLSSGSDVVSEGENLRDVMNAKIPPNVVKQVTQLLQTTVQSTDRTVQSANVTEQQVIKAITIAISHVQTEVVQQREAVVDYDDVVTKIVSQLVAEVTEPKVIRRTTQPAEVLTSADEEMSLKLEVTNELPIDDIKNVVKAQEERHNLAFEAKSSMLKVATEPLSLRAEEVTGQETVSAVKPNDISSAPAQPLYRPSLPVIHVSEKASFQAIREQFIQQFDQVVKTSKLTPFKNGQTLVIRLNPEHLGSMTIKLIETNGEMSARILTTNATTKELVEQSAQHLKQTLSLQTLEVKQFGADLPAQPSTWQDRQQQSESGQQRQQQQQRQKQQEEERSFQQWLDEER